MTKEDPIMVQKEKLYADYRRDLLSRQLYNCEKYDAAILTLSMASLGVSFTFIKDIIRPEDAAFTCVLVLSWIFFAISIILVVASFQISNQAIKDHINIAEEYYLKGNEDFANKRSIWAGFTTGINLASGFFFTFAVIFTIFFVTMNLPQKKDINMTTKTPLTKGAEIPSMQPAKPSGAAAQPAQNGGKNDSK